MLGRDAFDIGAAYADMRKRYVPLGHMATSLFDIALHDSKTKSLGVEMNWERIEPHVYALRTFEA